MREEHTMEVASRSTESRAEADKTARLGNALGWFSIGLGLAQITAPRSVARLIGLKDDGKSTALVRTIGVREVASGIGLLSQPRTPGWMWSRVAGDVMDLALLGSALNASATNRGRTVAATAAVLGVTALDVLYGQQLKRQQSEDPMGDESGTTAKGANREVTRSITISRPPDDVYRFWRRLDNLLQFMRHLESVEVIDQQRSHWRAKGPADKTVE